MRFSEQAKYFMICIKQEGVKDFPQCNPLPMTSWFYVIINMSYPTSHVLFSVSSLADWKSNGRRRNIRTFNVTISHGGSTFLNLKISFNLCHFRLLHIIIKISTMQPQVTNQPWSRQYVRYLNGNYTILINSDIKIAQHHRKFSFYSKTQVMNVDNETYLCFKLFHIKIDDRRLAKLILDIPNHCDLWQVLIPKYSTSVQNLSDRILVFPWNSGIKMLFVGNIQDVWISSIICVENPYPGHTLRT